MYITLEEIKAWCVVEHDEDDIILVGLIDTAETMVELHIQKKLIDLVDVNGQLPSPLTTAIKQLISHLYQNREIVSYINVKEIPKGFNFILDFYQKY